MNEIPFKIGSSLKWISGISNETTCKDIIISLLKTEKLLDCPEETAHRHYALVESWREVSKVLPANSLILKIWIAWGDEQQNVAFTVKRIKNHKREKPDKILTDNQPACEENISKGQKRLKRRNSRNSFDTLHPKALAKNKHIVCKDIQHQMKKIISQGEIIKKHLDQLKSLEAEEVIENDFKPNHTENDNLNDSGHVTDVSETISEYNELNVMKPNDTQNINENVNANTSAVDVCEFIQNCTVFSGNSETIIDNEQSISFSEPFEDEDTETGIQMLEQVHRLNRLLESKEEQLLTLDFEMKMHIQSNLQSNINPPTLESPATSCFDNEVKMFRELNAKLLKEISENSSVIQNLQEKTDDRKKLVTQLEFDVNVIERESKRLQLDLLKIEGIGSDFCEDKAPVKESSFPSHIPTPLSSSSSDSYQTSSSEKSVTFCDKDDVCSLNSSIFKNPLINVESSQRRSILKSENDLKLEYNSDASSDTGVSSLSSSEGDYSLSTLV